ncbi:Pro-rich N-terminal domain-containing protein, partial [Streptomyces sp. CRN 30]|uniref:Pro-rich N-terminal domain-containing protein n=1 Tax=Streptomyces sp. CRN 30 TaxID=3075613 RepID=UPI002A830CA4
MQHAVGAPLPPPHQPGHGPAAAWSSAEHHEGHPGHPGGAPTAPPGAGFAGAPVP